VMFLRNLLAYSLSLIDPLTLSLSRGERGRSFLVCPLPETIFLS
jgi:hypothetical protein